MITTHDDLPHAVPPFAYLRYKENWFFIIIDVANSVYGMAHFNFEPGHDRGRVSCNLMVRGELFKYGNQIPFPAQFALARQLGDDKLTVEFVEPHARIDLRLRSDDLDLDLSFLKNAPTFDYAAYDAANPNKVAMQELVNFATNQQFHHQQQAMTLAGSVRVKRGKSAGETIRLQGLGYRDHSRGMRCDNMSLRHVWTCLYFPKTVVGAVSLAGVLRPELISNSGYVYDADGMRALGDMVITLRGKGPEGMPATVEFELKDVYGKPFTITADIAARMGYVPLTVEAPNAAGYSYDIVENFAPVTLKETGEKGHALVEIGSQRKR
ncbi:MAG TPA: hypothetical protein VJQ47_09830 [Steroidobacteraceae bacterium]|nr:hypothetical protein [Steroidobacteraceae bacterium]